MIKVSNELMDNWNVILDEESIYNAYLSGDRHNSDCFLLSHTYFTDIQLNITNLQLINGVLYADINEVEGLPMNVERVNVEDGHLIAYYREGFGQMSRVDLGIVVGPKGDTGTTPDISVGIVTTGNPGTNASVNISGTKEEPVLNFTIPRGNTGEVSEEELDSAVKSMASPVYDNANGDIVTFDDGAKDALIKSLLATIKPVQSGSGDPSPTNIRPISGRTGMTVTASGSNLLNIQPQSGTVSGVSYVVDSDGYITLNGTAGAGCNIYLQTHITPFSHQLTISSDNAMPSNVYAGLVQQNGSSGLLELRPGDTTRTSGESGIAEESRYRIYVVPGVTFTNFKYRPMLNYGASALPYAPYTAQTYPVTWETEAGTIYGGTLDVVSGVLTVDKAMVDLGALNFILSSSASSIGGSVFQIPISKLGMAIRYRYTPNTMLSSIFATAPTERWFISTMPDNEVYSNETNVYFSASQYTDATAFKTAMSGVQLVYELATPQTYQLTPTEVRTILGGNTIYTDAGSVSVDYVADTGIYIDNSINKVKRLIAGIETTYVASRNYNVGDFIVVNNDLLKVISAIASGETIVIGTNANITTVAEQLILLFNS